MASCRLNLQHTPSTYTMDSHHLCKAVVFLSHQLEALHKDVSHLVSSGNKLKIKFFFIDFLPEEVVVDFDVFGAIMKLWVSCSDGKVWF